jgi:hypothetical protein
VVYLAPPFPRPRPPHKTVPSAFPAVARIPPCSKQPTARARARASQLPRAAQRLRLPTEKTHRRRHGRPSPQLPRRRARVRHILSEPHFLLNLVQSPRSRLLISSHFHHGLRGLLRSLEWLLACPLDCLSNCLLFWTAKFGAAGCRLLYWKQRMAAGGAGLALGCSAAVCIVQLVSKHMRCLSRRQSRLDFSFGVWGRLTPRTHLIIRLLNSYTNVMRAAEKRRKPTYLNLRCRF